MGLLFRILFCIFFVGLLFYLYIEKQNELTELRLAIPRLEREVKTINEENRQIQYEIDHFESPIHLMELARKPEFGHLRHPYVHEVLVLPEPAPLGTAQE